MLAARSSLTLYLATHPYHLSLLAGFIGYTLCPYRVECKICLCWSANTRMFLCESLLEKVVHEFVLASPAEPLHVLFDLLEQFVWWEVNGYTAVVLWCAASRVRSRQQVTHMCSSLAAFSLSVFFESMWCIHIIVWIHLQLGRNLILFYRIDQCNVCLITCLAFHTFGRWDAAAKVCELVH